jgi:hypothetical protein
MIMDVLLFDWKSTPGKFSPSGENQRLLREPLLGLGEKMIESRFFCVVCEPYRRAVKMQPMYLLINTDRKHKFISDDNNFKHSCIESISMAHSVDSMSLNKLNMRPCLSVVFRNLYVIFISFVCPLDPPHDYRNLNKILLSWKHLESA